MGWYLAVLKKYAVFSGRARRKEYWMFVLFNSIILIGLKLIGLLLVIVDNSSFWFLGPYVYLIQLLYLLAVLIPAFAVSVRRLHDIGYSGWWVLISCIPVIGAIIFIVFCVFDSEEGENRFGPNPKLAST